MPVLQQGSFDEDNDVNNVNNNNALLLVMCWHKSRVANQRENTGKK